MSTIANRQHYCLRCKRKWWDEGICGKCSIDLIGNEWLLNQSYSNALVCRDGRRWFAFAVAYNATRCERRLTLLASCDCETDAERAALAAVRAMGRLEEAKAWAGE